MEDFLKSEFEDLHSQLETDMNVMSMHLLVSNIICRIYPIVFSHLKMRH